MNGDSLEIMQAVGAMHADLQKQIGEVKTEIAELRGGIVARVENLEQDENRNFWLDKCEKWLPAPIFVSAHILMHKMGWKV
jgi:hypothetical protein